MGMSELLDKLLAARAAAPVVRATGLHKRYGSHEVLRGLDLALRRGEMVALLGDHGAGKSALLRCVAGLEGFQGGELTVDGRPPAPPGARRRPASLVFQGLGLTPPPAADAHPMAPSPLLARVGLADGLEASPGLWAAPRQRAAIARSLVPEPAVLLCDDITAADDPAQADDVGGLLQALATQGLGVLAATHDVALARWADRAVFLHAGRVHESGAPADLLDKPRTPELRRWLKAGRRWW